MIPMNILQPEWERLISVDVETAGPNPSQYSLLSIGACDLSLDRLSREGMEPLEGMHRFKTWLQETVPTGQRPIFVGFNASFDWMFVNDYFHRFLGHNPFGHAALDIKSYYMGMANVPWEATSMRFLGERFLQQTHLIHHARQDALDQAEIFRNLLLKTAGK
jgi:DNA polymerase III epsilon subunit-like protein